MASNYDHYNAGDTSVTDQPTAKQRRERRRNLSNRLWFFGWCAMAVAASIMAAAVIHATIMSGGWLAALMMLALFAGLGLILASLLMLESGA